MVSEETADGDPEVFDCDACPVSEHLETLDPFNCRVWAIYKQVVTRLAADLHAGGVVLTALTRDMSADEFTETWRRLLVLYEAIEPPPTASPQE